MGIEMSNENGSTEITALPAQETALQVFQADSGLDPYIQRIRDEVYSHVPDLSTKKGRDAIASLAFKVRKTKTALDAMGKALVDDLKDIPRKIDAERKRMRDELDKLADDVRKPLTEYEEAEQSRMAALVARIDELRALAVDLDGLDSSVIRFRLVKANKTKLGDDWQEYETEAARCKDQAVSTLTTALAVREKYEQDQAELAELRRKQAEQEQRDRDAAIAKEAEERATAKAEADAKAEREAAQRKIDEANAAAAKAEQYRLDAIERQKQAEARAEAEKLAAEQRAAQAAEAARLAEIERQRVETERLAEEQRKRESDRKHKSVINNEAMGGFINEGLLEADAKRLVTMIAKGLIPNVTINY